jgi:hypothetical protein
MRTLLLTLLTMPIFGGCKAPFNDQELTGILASPAPGEWTGPVDLRVRNKTGGGISCEAWETDNCPSIASFIADLAAIPDGEEVEIDNVACTYLDVSCRVEGDESSDLPLRVWGWSVTPPKEE